MLIGARISYENGAESMPLKKHKWETVTLVMDKKLGIVGVGWRKWRETEKEEENKNERKIEIGIENKKKERERKRIMK